jgi:hypothetical protein
MRWEWDVDGQIVSAELNLCTGRETIAVDGTPAFDKISWRLRNEVPIDLRSGRDAKVVVSARWGVIPGCVLEIEGVEFGPRIGATSGQIPWQGWVIVASVFLLAASLFVLLLWPCIHQIRGGGVVPPPRWTEADLLALPQDSSNVWHLIGHSHDVPPFNLDRSLLGPEMVPASAVDSVDAALQQPRIADFLHDAAEVRAQRTLASPHNFDEPTGDDFLRLPIWHDWILLSLKREIDRDPSTAANELAQLIPMWIQCANLARDGFTYLACAVQARRDLELTLELAKVLQDQDARARLAASIREAATLSSENVIIAEYITAHRGLESYRVNGKRIYLRRTDFKRTLTDIDDTFMSVMAGNACEERPLTQWGYNWGGKVFTKLLTAPVCMAAPWLIEVTEEVAKLRANVLLALSKGPN